MKFTDFLKVSTMMLAATTTIIGASAPSASARNSYVLTCKPGGNMYQFLRLEGGRISSTVYFKGGSAGASVQAPRPGECTWIDRGFRNGEPEKLLI